MAEYRVCGLSEIRPYERNPRVITEDAVSAVAKSIAAFGFLSPICVDKDGVILAGHTRYLAAKKLGLDKVPVLWADGLDGVNSKGYRIADNKTAEFSTWDRDGLFCECEELSSAADDLLGSIGLSAWEIDLVIKQAEKRFEHSEEEPADDKTQRSFKPFDDDVSELPQKKTTLVQSRTCRGECGFEPDTSRATRDTSFVKTRARHGDVFLLGGSKLVVGNNVTECDTLLNLLSSGKLCEVLREKDGVGFLEIEPMVGSE